MPTFTDNLRAWLAQPYAGATQMSALQWFLLVGLIIAISAGWRMILKHIEA